LKLKLKLKFVGFEAQAGLEDLMLVPEAKREREERTEGGRERGREGRRKGERCESKRKERRTKRT